MKLSEKGLNKIYDTARVVTRIFDDGSLPYQGIDGLEDVQFFEDDFECPEKFLEKQGDTSNPQRQNVLISKKLRDDLLWYLEHTPTPSVTIGEHWKEAGCNERPMMEIAKDSMIAELKDAEDIHIKTVENARWERFCSESKQLKIPLY